MSGTTRTHMVLRMASDADRLYFRQLLSGRDFAAADPIAQQMRNFAYLIGARETGDAVVVDPAYSAGELVDALAAARQSVVEGKSVSVSEDHGGCRIVKTTK